MFKKYNYYEDMNSNRLFRKAVDGRFIQEYINKKWVNIGDEWKALRVSWFPESQLKRRLKMA